jgi:Arc/MetJ-type ribon-helix-helix transcriptional regulator
MKKMSLPPALIKFAEQKVGEGLYKDQSEVVGEAMRAKMEKKTWQEWIPPKRHS